ncbi:MAG: tetraacyldisaccharide 4'-kinase [Candidatus Omnitrophica bacterium]|jgi:tetraacyldisaccharide 4'-kinase|nr:tetraacyldisaccharide 4'-kinase [Candidatus Omnitrophota bacterium]
MRKYLYEIITGKRRNLFLEAVLWVFSLVYTVFILLISRLRRANQQEFACKVISVGNITLGGTGKTVFVQFLCRRLSSLGKKVAVVSRGYRLNKNDISDEPRMLQEKLGDLILAVILDKNRARAIKKAISLGADTVILDDGFQQWGIKKDLEIVTLDAGFPFGNKKVLPAGILREPLGSLERADVLVLNKIEDFDTQDLKRKLLALNPSGIVLDIQYKPVYVFPVWLPKKINDIGILRARKIVSFCGIARPESFRKSLLECQAQILDELIFADHYQYCLKDIAQISGKAKEAGAEFILTTEKDAARLSFLKHDDMNLPVYVLAIEPVVLSGQDKFNLKLENS